MIKTEEKLKEIKIVLKKRRKVMELKKSIGK